MGTVSSSLNSPVTVYSGSSRTSGSGNSSSAGRSGSSANSTSSGSLFTGASAYSGDLQDVITRAVQIASLPITLLQNQQSFLTGQSDALTALDKDFTALQTAVQGIGTAMSGSSYQADISDPKIVSATLGDGATQGVYAIDVQDIGAYATSMTPAAWNSTETVAGTPDTFKLVVGSNTYKITGNDNSAGSVAAAINAQYGNLVNATVVNTGTDAAPDNRISLQSTTLGPVNLDILNAAGVSQQTQGTTPGRLASYQVDDSGKNVTSNSRTVTVSDGVDLTMLASEPGTDVYVTVTQSPSALDTAMSTFTNAYNQAVKDVDAQRGQAAGALEATPILTELQQALAAISTYASPGSQISGLNDLGLQLQDDGSLQYNEGTLLSTDIMNTSAVTAFMGSATTGGFLESATNTLTNLENATTGLLKNAETDTQTQITNIGSQIATKQAQVTALQTNLTNQMASADSMIAMVQQQYSEISGMFSAMQTEDQMYANG
jgi:flagellar hook-associated protein 2